MENCSVVSKDRIRNSGVNCKISVGHPKKNVLTVRTGQERKE